MVRNGDYPRYNLKVEPMRFAEGIYKEMRERELDMTPGCLTSASGRMKLPLTEMGKLREKQVWDGKIKSLVPTGCCPLQNPSICYKTKAVEIEN